MVWPPAGFVCLMAAVFFHANLASGQNDSCITGLPMADAGTFEINGSDFPSRNASVGLQVIIPGAAFTCHGYITSWSALIANFFYRYVTDSIETEIYFQLWRPVDGKYVLIDDDVVVISAQEITNEDGVDVINVMEEVQYLNFSGRAAEGNTRMYFQPGDVLGYFAPSFGFNKLGADLTFRTLTPDSSEPTVDVFYVNTSSGMTQPCEISVCGEAVSMIQSVIPQLSVAYEVIDPGTTMTPQLMCTDLEFEACPVTDVPHSPTPSITPSVVVPPLTSPNPESSSLPCADCVSKSTSDTFYTYIIAGIVAFVVITFIGIIIMFILCCKFCIYRRDKTYQDNQDYASPEDFIQLHEPLPRVPHYTSGNGALYALPNRDGDGNTALDNETLFDGSCYASTYQTNGRQHTYQEVSGTPTHHTGGVANDHDFSPTVLGRFGRHGSTQSEMFMNRSLRLHSHSSQTSVSMDTRRPSMPVRLTSTGSGSHVSVNSPAVRIPRVRLASASYSSPQFPYNDLFPLEEPPSCHPARSHTLPVSHPEESPAPPSVAGSETTNSSSTVKQQLLFHALDEEGFRVPTAEEREMYSTTEIYSRLTRAHSKIRDSCDSRDTTFFDQSDIYWEPPSSTTELYNQLAKRKYREIQRDQISCSVPLGSGHFGMVQRGDWQVPGGSMSVAVKTLKEGTSEEDKVKFLKEAAIMGQFLHPNVVKLHGVVTVGEPLMIVLELLPKGELKKFLRSFQKKSVPPDLPMLFLNFCRQIAVGMNYLSNKSFVHRDLATRNIFLTEDLTCKIGDFGMARDLAQDDIYHSQGGKVPLKWTAPEALNYRNYSTASDVWSYGMVLFEIWSLGRKPFEKVTVSKLVSVVSSGHCQPPPPGCPRAIYQLMVQCWHPVAAKRPTFSDITTYLNTSSDQLLTWTSADRIVSRRVTELGASLSEARNLYPDLQYSYDTS